MRPLNSGVLASVLRGLSVQGLGCCPRIRSCAGQREPLPEAGDRFPRETFQPVVHWPKAAIQSGVPVVPCPSETYLPRLEFRRTRPLIASPRGRGTGHTCESSTNVSHVTSRGFICRSLPGILLATGPIPECHVDGRGMSTAPVKIFSSSCSFWVSRPFQTRCTRMSSSLQGHLRTPSACSSEGAARTFGQASNDVSGSHGISNHIAANRGDPQGTPPLAAGQAFFSLDVAPRFATPTSDSGPSPSLASNSNNSNSANSNSSSPSRAKPSTAWQQQLSRLRQGCQWVGQLDSAVDSTIQEIVDIERELLQKGLLGCPSPIPVSGRKGVRSSSSSGASGPPGGFCTRSQEDGGAAAALSLGEAGGRDSLAPAEEKEDEAIPDGYSSGDDHQDFYEGPVAPELDRRFKARYSDPAFRGEALHRLFAARQVAIKLLLDLPRLCQACWLPKLFCMCQGVERAELPGNIVLWVYLHPKEFLSKNNTGKILWQVLGASSVRLCVAGVKSHEDAMWAQALECGPPWVLYPSRGAKPHIAASIPMAAEQDGALPPLHFILVDGTWNTSRAMVIRLEEQLYERRPDARLNFVTLSPTAPSIMHNIRIQPTKEKICTAAAASRLLTELSERPDLGPVGLSGLPVLGSDIGALGLPGLPVLGSDIGATELSTKGPDRGGPELSDRPDRGATEQSDRPDKGATEMADRPDRGAMQLHRAAQAIDATLAALLHSLAKRREHTGLSGMRLGVGKNKGYLQERKRY